MTIKGYDVWPLVKRVGAELWRDNVLTIAAAVAYNFFFSLFPLLLFAAPLVALVGDEQKMVGWILAQLQGAVPPAAYEVLRGIVRSVVFAPDAPGLVSVGALLTLYSASNIFGSLMGALNIAYGVKEDRRPWWKQRLLALGMVFVVGALFGVAATVMLGGPNLVDALASWMRIGTAGKWIWLVLQYPLAFAFLVLALWLIYTILPDFPQHRTQILAGSIVAALLWVVATIVFRQYVVHFNAFNKAYGTIGAVLLLLSWMYYSMIVVLAGGELNAELAKGTAQVAPEPKSAYDREVEGKQEERRAEEAAKSDEDREGPVGR